MVSLAPGSLPASHSICVLPLFADRSDPHHLCLVRQEMAVQTGTNPHHHDSIINGFCFKTFSCAFLPLPFPFFPRFRPFLSSPYPASLPQFPQFTFLFLFLFLLSWLLPVPFPPPPSPPPFPSPFLNLNASQFPTYSSLLHPPRITTQSINPQLAPKHAHVHAHPLSQILESHLDPPYRSTPTTLREGM